MNAPIPNTIVMEGDPCPWCQRITRRNDAWHWWAIDRSAGVLTITQVRGAAGPVRLRVGPAECTAVPPELVAICIDIMVQAPRARIDCTTCVAPWCIDMGRDSCAAHQQPEDNDVHILRCLRENADIGRLLEKVRDRSSP